MENQTVASGQPTFQAPLTRRALFALPEGMYLMSCVTDHLGTPLFAGNVPAADAKEALWRHLKELGVAGRTSWGFATVRDFQLFFKGTLLDKASPGSSLSGGGT